MLRIVLAIAVLLSLTFLIPTPSRAQRNRVGFGSPDSFYVRSETHLKCRTTGYSYAGENLGPCLTAGSIPNFPFELSEQSISLPGGSRGFVNIPRMASKFVAPADQTSVSIAFSAMHWAGTVNDEPLMIRVLIDGTEAEPGAVLFTAGFSATRFAANSYTFAATVSRGLHIVQVQYSSESNSKLNYLRNASLLVTVDSQDDSKQRVHHRSGQLEKKLTKADHAWTTIPQSDLAFNTTDITTVQLNFSSVVRQDTGDFVLIRAVIDGDPVAAVPVHTTLVGRAFNYGARTAVFTTNPLKPGAHNVRFEWMSSLTDVIASATINAWTATAITAPRTTKTSEFKVVPQTALATTTQTSFSPIPTLEADVQVDQLSDIAVTLSGAYAGPGVVIATISVDGSPVTEQETVIYAPAIRTDEKTQAKVVYDAGVQSYTFALKNVAPRGSTYKIGAAYRVVEAGVTVSASGTIYNATLSVMSKPRIGPDLAVGPNMGMASKKHESLIEPIHGTRPVVAIIFDPNRSNAPSADRFYRAGIDRVLNGAAPSTADYYNVVSAGHFQLNEVTVLGPYAGKKGGGDTSTNHYWDRDAHDPNEDGDCSDSTDEYCSPFLEQQAEALSQAANDFDFEKYDTNRDGTLSGDELGILIVTPQYGSSGSNTNPSFSPFAAGDQFSVDGVVISTLIHWYSEGIGDGTNDLVGLESAMVAAHEMSHLFLNLDDTYGPVRAAYDASGAAECPEDDSVPCESRAVNTAPHPVSLMTYKTIDSSPHLDGFHKLHLGWVTPSILVEPNSFTLGSVQQTRDVYILPRYGTDGREYVVLETRYLSTLVNDPGYDYGIGDSGLAVYHIIEPGPGCKDANGATAADCTPLLKPQCLTSDFVWDRYFSNFVRPGLRLIQPDLVHERTPTYIDYSQTLFGTKWGDELLDTLGGGAMMCPINIGDPLPAGAKTLLLWSDGGASGYRLKSILLDSANKSVTFDAEMDAP